MKTFVLMFTIFTASTALADKATYEAAKADRMRAAIARRADRRAARRDRPSPTVRFYAGQAAIARRDYVLRHTAPFVLWYPTAATPAIFRQPAIPPAILP